MVIATIDLQPLDTICDEEKKKLAEEMAAKVESLCFPIHKQRKEALERKRFSTRQEREDKVSVAGIMAVGFNSLEKDEFFTVLDNISQLENTVLCKLLQEVDNRYSLSKDKVRQTEAIFAYPMQKISTAINNFTKHMEKRSEKPVNKEKLLSTVINYLEKGGSIKEYADKILNLKALDDAGQSYGISGMFIHASRAARQIEHLTLDREYKDIIDANHLMELLEEKDAEKIKTFNLTLKNLQGDENVAVLVSCLLLPEVFDVQGKEIERSLAELFFFNAVEIKEKLAVLFTEMEKHNVKPEYVNALILLDSLHNMLTDEGAKADTLIAKLQQEEPDYLHAEVLDEESNGSVKKLLYYAVVVLVFGGLFVLLKI